MRYISDSEYFNLLQYTNNYKFRKLYKHYILDFIDCAFSTKTLTNKGRIYELRTDFNQSNLIINIIILFSIVSESKRNIAYICDNIENTITLFESISKLLHIKIKIEKNMIFINRCIIIITDNVIEINKQLHKQFHFCFIENIDRIADLVIVDLINDSELKHMTIATTHINCNQTFQNSFQIIHL